VGVDNGGGVKAVVTGGTAPYTYLWSTTPVQTADNITGMPNGPYVVYVTDAKNCRDTASALVAYDNCCKPFIPDAFTPNADGRNDKFHVLWKGDIQLLNFSVYNRYGQRIFYTTSTEAGWDGTWNSQPQDLGTYFYYIKMICGNGGDNVLEYKGDVTLIR
jgi:gliding motility-associated-like protein